MEPVVFEETPLADYLKEGGDESDVEWAPAIHTPDDDSSVHSEPSPSIAASRFAPSGRPTVKKRSRNEVSDGPRYRKGRPSSLQLLRQQCSAAIAANIDRADQAKFLEQFRYTIVASQLLSGHSPLGGFYSNSGFPAPAAATLSDQSVSLPSIEGFAVSILGALVIALVLSWVLGTSTPVTWRRIALLLILVAASAVAGGVYVRRQSWRNCRTQALSGISEFVSNSQDFDNAVGAALGLVQEVELVSKGYRIAPLPPISRLEDRTQSRKCGRLRQASKDALNTVTQTYVQVSNTVRGFCEQTELEKYYDIYDISDLDMSDALRDLDHAGLEDPESVRALKILAARFNTVRKMILCALLALDSNTDGNGPGLARWATAAQGLQSMNLATKDGATKLQRILDEEDSLPTPQTPKAPLTPGRERWRSQLRKLNSMSTGIRGLQAKLQLLREESDRVLNDSSDLSELGPDMMSQYESIGSDLRDLMVQWEEGKSALALGIDRNEKRLSSMSTLISPSSSISGITSTEEGGAADALKALTGESPAGKTEDASFPDSPEVFEAVALPRARSTLTREERISKMKDEREQRAQARQQLDATKGMLRELETVINLRPRSRTSVPIGRVVSM